MVCGKASAWCTAIGCPETKGTQQNSILQCCLKPHVNALLMPCYLLQARMSVLDSGFMLGDGVWEGMCGKEQSNNTTHSTAQNLH
jgi:hypothetical protein